MVAKHKENKKPASAARRVADWLVDRTFLVVAGIIIGFGGPGVIWGYLPALEPGQQYEWADKATWLLCGIPIAWALQLLGGGPKLWRRYPVSLALAFCLGGGGVAGLVFSNMLYAAFGAIAMLAIAHYSSTAKMLVDQLTFQKILPPPDVGDRTPVDTAANADSADRTEQAPAPSEQHP